MRLAVRVDGRESSLEFRETGGKCRFRHGDSEERVADVRQVEPGVYSVILEDGRSFEAKIEAGLDGVFVASGGRRFAVQVSDPRRWAPRRAAATSGGRQFLSAPMPGKVVRLLVSQGDPVEAGQGIAVVEAMKMQNEMKSARAGTVISLSVKEGDTVSAGQVLACIE
jgi:biotin carboxyl carrier protein